MMTTPSHTGLFNILSSPMGHLLSSISPLTIKAANEAANEAVRESTHVKGHGQYLALNTKIKTAKQQGERGEGGGGWDFCEKYVDQ